MSCLYAGKGGAQQRAITLYRPDFVTITRHTSDDTSISSYAAPTREGNTLRWPSGVTLEVVKGAFASMNPEGYKNEYAVGNGLLKVIDPMPKAYPAITFHADNGLLRVEIHAAGADKKPANCFEQ